MAIYLFEPKELRQKFFPLSKTRAVVDLLLGGLSIQQWWTELLGQKVEVLTATYLQKNSPMDLVSGDTLIYGGLQPNHELVNDIFEGLNLYCGSNCLAGVNGLLCCRVSKNVKAEDFCALLEEKQEVFQNGLKAITFGFFKEIDSVFLMNSPSKFLSLQGDYIKRLAQKIVLEQDSSFEKSKDTQATEIDSSDLILAKGCRIEQVFLNTDNGPIIIDKDAVVMAGAMLRGPIYLGPRSVVKMGTRIYGPLVTACDCTIGGELKNVVFHRGSNKAHDGYLGDSVIGSWCNFGAGSGGSNVKNTAGEVRLYDYSQECYIEVGQKFGAVIGDYTRIGVGTQLTTGASIGVCCNLFGLEMIPKLVTDFLWGTTSNLDVYQLEKAKTHIEAWMLLKGVQISVREIQILNHIFGQTDKLP